MSYHIITPDPYEDSARRRAAVGPPPPGHEQRRIKVNTIVVVVVAVVAVFLLLRISTNNSTSSHTVGASKATQPVPVHQAPHLTVDMSFFDSSVNLRSVFAHVVKDGHRTYWHLMCTPWAATCAPLTPNEDYDFEIVHGLPECRWTAQLHEPCIEIRARPYDAIYVIVEQCSSEFDVMHSSCKE